jgi:chitinase
MIPEKLQEIMKKDGVVAIATLGPDGPYMVNTWNSYLRIEYRKMNGCLSPRLYAQNGGKHCHNPDVLITLESSKVEGLKCEQYQKDNEKITCSDNSI